VLKNLVNILMEKKENIVEEKIIIQDLSKNQYNNTFRKRFFFIYNYNNLLCQNKL
jgi:hypothetical protein